VPKGQQLRVEQYGGKRMPQTRFVATSAGQMSNGAGRLHPLSKLYMILCS